MRHSGARLPSRRVRAATAASTAVSGAGRGDPVISSASCTTRRCPATASKFQLEKVRISNRSLSTVIVIVWKPPHSHHATFLAFLHVFLQSHLRRIRHDWACQAWPQDPRQQIGHHVT